VPNDFNGILEFVINSDKFWNSGVSNFLKKNLSLLKQNCNGTNNKNLIIPIFLKGI
jgi:hypothetical protein